MRTNASPGLLLHPECDHPADDVLGEPRRGMTPNIERPRVPERDDAEGSYVINLGINRREVGAGSRFELARPGCPSSGRTCMSGCSPRYRRGDPSDACGHLAVRGGLIEASRRGLAIERLALRNSGGATSDRRSVIGYGAWAFYARW